jgi:hypothetical protein
MTERSWMRFLNSLSNNLKSQIQNRKWVGIVAVVVTFAICGEAAMAQQPKKILRIGYLSPQGQSRESLRAEAIRLALASMGTSKARTSLSNTDLRRENSIGSLSLLRSWCVSTSILL